MNSVPTHFYVPPKTCFSFRVIAKRQILWECQEGALNCGELFPKIRDNNAARRQLLNSPMEQKGSSRLKTDLRLRKKDIKRFGLFRILLSASFSF
ncbi:hypothetical protein TNIN_119831 [Trichonephila inaurata madagascariensis]|uniref:Uncharacterized protein n=1 Tax=Trichonephila inaurata madagascariensis TaxID=2747483 RepID=A0A8X6Y097_9ARAC|nr:hypothetical protein TNIN_119831 [Trichonephila inaurata madagascariensis]